MTTAPVRLEKTFIYTATKTAIFFFKLPATTAITDTHVILR